MKNDMGVHWTHCCILHGCKYGDRYCPVANGEFIQRYLCQDCDDDGITSFEQLEKVCNQEIKTCPNCNTILFEKDNI